MSSEVEVVARAIMQANRELEYWGEPSEYELVMAQAALTAARPLIEAEARRKAFEEAAEWQPFETAPRDGTRIWAILRADEPQWPNRSFEIWHEGVTEGGFDLGWTLFPGYGGMSDRHFAGWMPLPPPPAPRSADQ